MVASIIINDFGVGKRITSIIEVSDFAIIRDVWHNEDEIMISMQEYDFFAGRTRWCDLDPAHFRLMIMRNLNIASEMTDEDRMLPTHPIIQSLHFLIGAMIHCLQLKSDSVIEIFRIHRFNDHQVNYDYTAVMNIELDYASYSPEGKGFKIVVDNE